MFQLWYALMKFSVSCMSYGVGIMLDYGVCSSLAPHCSAINIGKTRLNQELDYLTRTACGSEYSSIMMAHMA